MTVVKPKKGSSFFIALLSLGSVLLTSCAALTEKSKTTTSTTTTTSTEETKVSATEAEKIEATVAASKETSAADLEKASIEDIIRIEEPNTQTLYDNSHYDFPITMNSAVEGWIDYFTGRGREHMERYLGRSSRYIPSMRKILKRDGLPEDLVYLALIESGFNMKAKSRARAVGPWQFMRATGTRYGLRVDPWIDGRRDPVHSTEAAARYLKDLYLIFESWYLSAAAYNAGEYKILRAVEALKSNNFWTIRASKKVRRETKDYVPKLIAAAIIAKNPDRYGFGGVTYDEPLNFETVTVTFPIHLRELSKLVNEPVEELEDLNPELLRSMVPPDVASYELRVPMGTKVLVERALGSIRNKLAADENEMPKEHIVRGGETLASIARRYRVQPASLMNTNNLGRKEKVKAGDRLLIPDNARVPATRAPRVAAVSRPTPKVAEAAPKDLANHKVRSGESLWAIALKYDVTIQEIYKWNNLDRPKIYPGMTLKVRKPAKSADEEEDEEAREPAKGGDEKEETAASAEEPRHPADNAGFVTHVVQPGESLWSISKDYDVSIREIKKWNKLHRSAIAAGKRLKIKSAERAAASERESRVRHRRRSRNA